MSRGTLGLIFALALCGCSSSGAPGRLAIPAHVVADTVVVPFELTAAYEALENAEPQYRWGFREPAAVLRSIEERRAYIYWDFDPGPWALPGLDEINIETIPADEGAFDNMVADLARQVDFSITSSYYDDWPGSPDLELVNEDYRTMTYYLRSNRALSRGEIAWLADWLLLQAPSKIIHVAPGGDDTDIILPAS